MNDYINPAAGLPETNIPNNPFWSGVNQGQRTQMMQPFLDMAQQNQASTLQRTLMENQEFASPDAQEMRLAERGSKTAQFQSSKAKSLAEIEALPHEQQLKIAELGNKLRGANAQPYRELFSELGTLSDRLDQLPPERRAGEYAAALTRWEMTHEGKSVPQQFKQYSPQVHNELKAIRHALVMTPEHEQKLNERALQNSGDLAVQQLRNEGGLAQANVQASATRDAASQRASGRENPGQFRVSNLRILNNPNSTEEEVAVAQENLESLATDSFERVKKNDQRLANLSLDYVQAMGNPQKQQEVAAKQEKIEREIWEEHLVKQGARVRVKNPQGQPGILPRSKLKAAKAAGYTEVK